MHSNDNGRSLWERQPWDTNASYQAFKDYYLPAQEPGRLINAYREYRRQTGVKQALSICARKWFSRNLMLLANSQESVSKRKLYTQAQISNKWRSLMSLPGEPILDIPELTVEIAWSTFPNGKPGQMKGYTFGTLYFARETLENTRSASLVRRSDRPK